MDWLLESPRIWIVFMQHTVTGLRGTMSLLWGQMCETLHTATLRHVHYSLVALDGGRDGVAVNAHWKPLLKPLFCWRACHQVPSTMCPETSSRVHPAGISGISVAPQRCSASLERKVTRLGAQRHPIRVSLIVCELRPVAAAALHELV
jgi:hypothetical protein